MIKLEKTQVYGLDNAIRAMRNPLNSWKKSDSSYYGYCFVNDEYTDHTCTYDECYKECSKDPKFQIGETDMKLCKALIKAGSSDRKFLRMIHVQVDITAPLYFLKEFDTYKISTVANSCSTMHKIHSRDLTIDDFSHEHLEEPMLNTLKGIIDLMNLYRKKFVETKDKTNWWQIIQMLPTSYNQMRTWDGSYETLLSMYFQRRNHKLDEWHTLCDWILELPYMKDFIGALEEQKEEKKEKKEDKISDHMVDNLMLNNQI